MHRQGIKLVLFLRTLKRIPLRDFVVSMGLLRLRLRYALDLIRTTLVFTLLLLPLFFLTRGGVGVPHAYAATSDNLNFQARLETSTGAIAADGYYNIQFKLYDASTGGTLLWTETYYDSNGVTAGNDNRVRVANGYVTVNLGSQTAFPGTMPWDQQLYLTMNVGGTTQTATPTWDGEMSPRLKLTAVPYAFNAKTAGQIVTTSGANTASLSIQAPTGGNQIFLIPDQGAGGTYTLLTGAAADGNYIQNQNSTDQSANFRIDGSGRADSFTANSRVTVGSSSTQGEMVLHAGNSFTTTLKAGTSGANRTIVLPVTTGSNGDCVLTDGAGQLSFGSCPGAGGSGVTTVGTVDSQAKSDDGAVISGVTIYLQTAQVDKPGLVGTAAQTFAGNKTFQDGITLATANTSQDRILIAAANLGSNRFDGTITNADLTSTRAWTLPDASGTIAVSASGNIALSATGNISFTGQLPVANGGTGQSSLSPQYGVLYGNGTGGIGVTATGSTGECLLSGNGTGAPSFGVCPGDGAGTGAAGGDLYGNYPNPNVGGLRGTAVTITALTTHDLLVYNGTAWVNATAAGDITNSVSGNTNTFTIANGSVTSAKMLDGTIGGVDIASGTIANSNLVNSGITINNGTNITGGGTVALGGSLTIGLTGTVAIANGGTNNTSFTTNGSVYYDGSSLTATAAGITGQCLVGNTGAAPSWTSCASVAGGANTSLSNIASTNLSAALNVTAGDLTLQTTTSGNIVLNTAAGSSIELQDATNVTGNLGVSGTINTATISGGSLSSSAVNGLSVSGGTVSAGTWQGTALADAYVADDLTISSAGAVDWLALSNYPSACAAGEAVTALGDTITCNTFAASSGSGNYIQNQNASQQASSNFWISGTGRADTSIQTPLLDTATATALNIGTTNATQISLNQNTVIAPDKSLTINRTNGVAEAMLVQGSGTNKFYVDNTTASGIKVGIGENCTSGRFCVQQTINTAGPGPVYTQNSITNIVTTGATEIYGQRISLDDDSSAIANTNYGLFVLGTSSSNNSATFHGIAVNNRAVNPGTLINLQSAGTTVFSVNNAGNNLLYKNRVDATTSFQIQNANAVNVLNVDTTNGEIELGSYNGGTNPVAGKIVIATTANANAVTLQSAAQSGNYTLDIPALAGNATICTSNSTTACGNFIQNQNAAQQASSNFWISGTGRADTSILTPLVDTATATALNIGTTNATQINLNEQTVLTAATSGDTPIFTVNQTDGSSKILELQSSGTARFIARTSGAIEISTAGTNSDFSIRSGGTYLYNFDTLNRITVDNGTTTPGNLLENPGFESDAYAGLSGWSLIGASTIETANPHTGNRNLQITPNGTNLGVADSKYYTASQGETFYIEGWTKAASGTNGSASLAISYYNSSDSLMSSTLIAANGTTSYAKVSGTGTAPANTAYIRVRPLVDNSSTTGTWYFDDLYFAKVSQPQPLSIRPTTNATNVLEVQNAAGTQIFAVNTTSGTATIQGNTILTSATGIQLQASTPGTAQTGHFNISGTGIASTFNASTSILTPLVDTATAVALNIGTSNATSINIGNGATTNISVVAPTTFTNTVTVDGNSTSQFVIKNGANTFVNVDTTGSQMTVGNSTACTSGTGKLCVGSSQTSGGTNAANVYNLTGGTGVTANGQKIIMTDTGTLTGNKTIGLIVDGTGTTNANTEVNGILVKSMSANAGNLIQLQTAVSSSKTAFSVTNAGLVKIGTPYNGGNGITGQMAFYYGTGSGNTGSVLLQAAAQGANNYTLTIPALTANADICTNLNNCGGLTSATGIQNQNASAQATSVFWISGDGRSTTSFTTPLLQSAPAAALTITGNAASTWSTSSGLLTVSGAGGLTLNSVGASALTLDSTTTGAINIGTGANAKTITFGNTTTTTSVKISSGTGGIAMGDDAVSSTINIGGVTNDTASTVNIATNATTADTVTIGSTSTSSASTIQGSDGKLYLTAGKAWMYISPTSATAFRILVGPSTQYFAVDTTNSRIQVGSSTTNATAMPLVLDSYSTAGDPTGVNGAMYYSTATGAFRCYQEGAWHNCLGGALSSITADSTTLNGNTAGAQNFSTTYTMPANYCTQGRVVHLGVTGIYSSTTTAQPMSFTVKLGTTAISAGSATITPAASQTNETWVMDYTFTCRAAPSASSAVYGQGDINMQTSATATTSQTIASATPTTGVNVATNAAQAVTLAVTFTGTASVSNTITIKQMLVNSY